MKRNRANPQQLALIHVAKAQLGLSEDEYREILKAHGGAESAKFLDDLGVDRVLKFFYQLGFKRAKSKRRDLRILASDGQKKMIHCLMEDLGWDRQRLSGFVDRVTAKDYPEELTKQEASKVIEGLKAMRDRKVIWH